jgi:uncharacterized membrane protein YeaQ/YmgE (transglycosylase-associated protein family)
MLWLISWVIFGVIVGLIAKALHPGEDPVGFLPTIGIGIVGSYVGGIIEWAMGRAAMFSSSGFIMSILGAVIFLWIYRKYHLKQYFKAQALKAQQNSRH